MRILALNLCVLGIAMMFLPKFGFQLFGLMKVFQGYDAIAAVSAVGIGILLFFISPGKRAPGLPE